MSSNAEEHSQMAEYLRPLEAVESLNELHVLLSSSDLEIVRRACFVLGQVGQRRSSGRQLSELLESAESAEIRDSAASALAYLGGVEAERALIRALRSDREEHVRARAAHSLGHIHRSEAVKALTAVLEEATESWPVLDEAAESLGFIGGPEVVDVLIRTLEHPVAEVRTSAAYALGLIGDPAAIPALERTATELADPGSPLESEARAAIDAIQSTAREAENEGERGS